MAEVELKLAGYCPSCGAEAVFRPIGDQEDPGGEPIALGNCSACGSTVALSSVDAAARAAWPRGCQRWTATVRRHFAGEYTAEVTVDAGDLRALTRCVADAVRELGRLSQRGAWA